MSNKNYPENKDVESGLDDKSRVDDRPNIVDSVRKDISHGVRSRRPEMEITMTMFDICRSTNCPALEELASVFSGFNKNGDFNTTSGPSTRMLRGFFLAKTIQVEKLNETDRKHFEVMMKLMQEYYENEGWDTQPFAIDDGGKGLLLSIVTSNGMALQSLQRFIDPKLLSDRDVILAAVKNAGQALQFAAPQLHADPEIIHAAVQNDGSMLRYASPELRGNKEFVIMAVRNTDKALEFASPELREDREVLLAARKIGMRLPDAHRCVGRALKNDKEIVLASILSEVSWSEGIKAAYRGGGEPITNVLSKFHELTFPRYVSEELMHDEEVLLATMSIYGGLFDEIPKEMETNRKIALAAVSNFGPALAILPDAFRSDKDIVLVAVAQDGEALEFASDDMKADKDVVLAAVAQDARALQFASDDMKADKDVVLAAVAQDVHALQFASDDMKSNKDVVLAAVARSSWALEYASDRLKDDEEVVLHAIEKNGVNAFQYASTRLRAQKHIVLKALSVDRGDVEFRYVEAFEYVTSEDIKQDHEVINAFKCACERGRAASAALCVEGDSDY